MDLFCLKSIPELIEDYCSKELSVVEAIQETIETSEKFQKFEVWNSFSEEILLREAKVCQELIDKGKIGLVSGIPIAVKDVMNTYHYTTEMGSILWKGFEAGNDARIVHNLKYEGGIVAGKTVTAEFAVHALNKTLNPYDTEKTPGTSSSGSAVAVALGIVPAALGTQTGASIMRPSSFCGVYGYKPSFGLVSRTGILKTTDSLDSIGFLTSNIKNIKPLFETLSVKGIDYPFSYKALNDFDRQKRGNRPWKIAFVKTYTWKEADEYVKVQLIDWVSKISKDPEIVVEEINLDDIIQDAHNVHATIYNKSLSYYFKNEHLKREEISDIMNEMIEVGEKISIADYTKAIQAQEDMCAQIDDILKEYDAIISLSTATEAVKRGEREKDDPSLIWTLLHLASVNIPLFKNNETGMPFGMQISSRKYNDYLLMDLLEFLNAREFIPTNIREIKYKDFDI